jgi:hypothetical protein
MKNDRTQSLEMFLSWAMNSPNFGPMYRIPYGQDYPVVHRVQDVTSTIIYRKDVFQIQLFVAQPNTIVPEHTHPNCESYEVLMGGDVSFSTHGRWVTEKDFLYLNRNKELIPGTHPFRARCLHIPPDCLHGGVFGPRGAAWWSVQKWLNGVDPSCVGNDYTGKTCGEEHAVPETGDPIVMKKEQLVWQDAAGLAEYPPEFVPF